MSATVSGVFEGLSISFDLDGTLVDTAPDLVRSTNVVMNQLGLPRIALKDVRHMVGQGARALIIKAVTKADVPYTDADIDTYVAQFLEEYQSGLYEQSICFPGVEDALDALIDQGAILSVCTNKPPHLANPVLEAFDLHRRFKVIVGNNQAGVNKPDGRHLSYTIEAAGGTCDRALMIGDSLTDVLAARNANVPVALVSFGYTEKKASALGADAVFDHYNELPALARRLLQI